MVKANILRQQTILLPSMASLDEDSFKDFVRWSNEVGAASIPHEQFKAAAIGQVSYTAPLEEVIEQDLEAGGVKMIAKLTPTYFRPPYSDVLDKFGAYLFITKAHPERGIENDGLKKIGDEMYISVDLALASLQQERDKVFKEKRNVKKELAFTAPEELVDYIPESVTIIYNTNYGAFTESNARAALQSKNFVAKGNEAAKSFKERLLNDSLAIIGDTPKQMEVVDYPLKNFIFRHSIIPERTPENKDIYYALAKPAPTLITAGSKIGDYQLLKLWKDYPHILETKRLITPEFMQDYSPKVIDDLVYARLDGVLDRFLGYREKFIKPTLNQRFNVVPM